MTDYDRYVTCTLGALLMDGIITADPQDIEKVIYSIERAWVHITMHKAHNTRYTARDVSDCFLQVLGIIRPYHLTFSSTPEWGLHVF